jgi:RimJ/RimL family protein N-acetyltransferase
MTPEESTEMLEGLFKLVKEIRPAPTPKTRLSGYETKMLRDQGVTITDLGDYALLTEGRYYGRIEQYIEWLAEQADIKVRSLLYRPAQIGDDAYGFFGFQLADAVGLIIYMEQLGLMVSAALLVEELQPDLANRSLLTEAEYSILTYNLWSGRRLMVIRSTAKRGPGAETVEKFRSPTGYRYKMVRQNGQALSLEVRGPKYRELKQESINCEYCGMTYLSNTPAETRAHRQVHRRAARLLDPEPNTRFAKLLAENNQPIIVDSQAPMWMQKEVYRRALRFKRDFRYDFVQWAGDDVNRVKSGWHGHLIPAGPDGTIAGACAFSNVHPGPDGVEWTLAWVWVAPKYRGQGLLTKYWPWFIERYGNFFIEPPLSDAMTGFVRSHGTESQQSLLASDTCDQ